MGLEMQKITNYILNGQGLGLKFLTMLAVLMALIFAITVRVKGVDFIPYAQEIADQMLPIKIENGEVVYPKNTFKMAKIQLDEYSKPMIIPFVIDTRVDTLDASSLEQGIYLTRTTFYTVSNNQVKFMKLEGNLQILKADYTQAFRSWLNWFAVIGGIFGIFFLFVVYFILAMFYALCAQFIAWISSKNMDFDRRMRLSSVALITTYLGFLILDIFATTGSFLFFVVMIGLIITFMVKKAPTAKETVTIETPIVEAKIAETKKAPVKKAPAKKKPVAQKTEAVIEKAKPAEAKKAPPKKTLVKKAAAKPVAKKADKPVAKK